MATFLVLDNGVVSRIHSGFEYENDDQDAVLRQRLGISPTDTNLTVHRIRDADSDGLNNFKLGQVLGKQASITNENVSFADAAQPFVSDRELQKIRTTYLKMYVNLNPDVLIGQAIGKGERQAAIDSIDGMRNYFSHVTQAAIQVARLEVGATWTLDRRIAFLNAYHSLASIVRTQYLLMLASAGVRDSWRGFSTADGSAVHIDYANANGDVRKPDTSTTITLTGASFGATFNPEDI